MKSLKVIMQFLSLMFFAIAIIDCDKNSTEPEQPKIRGEIISANSLKVYSINEIKQLITAYNIPFATELTYSVEVIQMVYQTVDSKENYIQASGAIMIPAAGKNLPLLSLHHGTETKRELVASVSPFNSTEGIVGLMIAATGYFCCIPDYPGFGVSEVLHPYIHAQSLSIAAIDYLRAAKSYCAEKAISLNGQLFLTGYSEGGYVTLAVQKEIEQNYAFEFNVTAVAPMEGPYDLAGTVKSIIEQSTYNSPAYIGYVITAYNEIYGWNRLQEIFNDPYGEKMPGLFNGSKTFGEINSQLPVKITELLRPNFIHNCLNENDTEFISAIEENSLLNWTPNAPIRFYHGDADDTVPYQNALSALDNLRANGGTNIELITLEGKDHATAGLPAILGMIDWLNSF